MPEGRDDQLVNRGDDQLDELAQEIRAHFRLSWPTFDSTLSAYFPPEGETEVPETMEVYYTRCECGLCAMTRILLGAESTVTTHESVNHGLYWVTTPEVTLREEMLNMHDYRNMPVQCYCGRCEMLQANLTHEQWRTVAMTWLAEAERMVRWEAEQRKSEIKDLRREQERLTQYEANPPDFTGQWVDEEEDEYERSDGPIHCYSYLPRLHFHGKKYKGPFMGIELEAEAYNSTWAEKEETAAQLDHRTWHGNPFWFVKEDGSLDNGFEVVSHPAKIEVWREGPTSEVCQILKRDGFKSYNTSSCGLHIHVGRGNVSRLDTAKLCRLFVADPEWVRKVSRRRSHQFRQWAAVIQEGESPSVAMKKMSRKAWMMQNFYEDGRYTAINTCPGSTIEFRIFRGTLHEPALLRNIELVHAMIQFAKDRSIADMTPDVFQDWLTTARAKTLITKEVSDDLETWLTSLDPRREETECETLSDSCSL